MRIPMAVLIALLLLTAVGGGGSGVSAAAREQGALEVAAWSSAFATTWARADRPVAELAASRTWLWGPEAFTPGLLEPYAEGPAGQRVVQYYDKSRMEIATDPSVAADSPWYVTNGLLALELITGRMQTGDAAWEQLAPAVIPVAGDPDDTSGPTYATFATLLTAPATSQGELITRRVTRAGVQADDPTLAAFGVRAAQRVTVWGIDHSVASPFWTFMTSEGLTWIDGAYRTAPLFANPYYATGYPVTEAYWTTVRVGGTPTDVLVQCFERRCLTWTPSNPEGWAVETGNIGRHAYAWRYATRQPVPAPVAAPVVVLDIGHEQGSGGALGTEYRETLRTGLATADALRAAGYTVFLTRADNATSLLAEPALLPPNAASMDAGYVEGYVHASKALQFDPDLVLSLHYNGSESSAQAGMTVYFCDVAGEQNQRLALLVRDALQAALRSMGYEPPYALVTEDGAIGKVYGHLASLGNVYAAPFDFVENRMVGVPMVLTEPLFMTNAVELGLLADDATHAAFAAAYVQAVDTYFGR